MSFAFLGHCGSTLGEGSLGSREPSSSERVWLVSEHHADGPVGGLLPENLLFLIFLLTLTLEGDYSSASPWILQCIQGCNGDWQESVQHAHKYSTDDRSARLPDVVQLVIVLYVNLNSS